jgi:hypothetical protein
MSLGSDQWFPRARVPIKDDYTYRDTRKDKIQAHRSNGKASEAFCPN